jgi:uncharacterized glyoxalase superfamily protein PhnB
MADMICPCLTYLDMQAAMSQLDELFGLEIVWMGNDAAEIRWHGGVAVAQADRPEDLHGSHVGHGWTYVKVADPDEHYARALGRGANVLNEPHSTSDGRQRGYSARDREGNIWTFAVQEFGLA